MRIDNVSFANYPDALVLSGRMTPDRGPARDLWWRVDGAWEAPHTPGDPFAVGLLAPCMWMGEPLRIDAPVAPALLEGQEHGQRVLRAWYDALDHVPLSAPLQAEDAARANDTPEGGVACCFTGGVDSWYSLLAHDHEITHLLLVRGFDVALDDDVQWAAALSAARRAADETGKRLVTVSTNLRQVADMRRADWGPRHDGDFWGRILHGAALASVGLVLQSGLRALIVPATHHVDDLRPWGSSPKLDHWWSGEGFEVRHEGCSATRFDKVARIARSAAALDTLRVCYANTGEHNCGRCEKCLRTMAALRLCGALDRSAAFPSRAHLLSALRRLEVPEHLLYHHRALLDHAERLGDRALARSLRALLGERLSLERVAARAVRSARALRAHRMEAAMPAARRP